jgi:DNA-binding response OmpR family regulator
MKEDSRLSHIPVIFLSATATKAEIAEGLKMGVVEYVVKPFVMRDLAALIKRVIG